MDYMTFGRTGLQLSRLALGTGNFGTGYPQRRLEGDAQPHVEAAGARFSDFLA